MTRLDELKAILGPYLWLRDGVDYEAIPDDQWPKWINEAHSIAAHSQKWFKIGISRAINEIKSKNADGTPRWPSREALINHLSQINEPNRG